MSNIPTYLSEVKILTHSVTKLCTMDSPMIVHRIRNGLGTVAVLFILFYYYCMRLTAIINKSLDQFVYIYLISIILFHYQSKNYIKLWV